jgi:outer membrane protein OmpA-like peptidoglycan-associated protein
MVTGEDGVFTTVDLEPGTYTFNVTAQGFREGQCDVTVPLAGGVAAPTPAPPADPIAPVVPNAPAGCGAPPPAAAPVQSGKPANLAIQAQCELDALPKVGNVAGSLVDAQSGAPVGGARVVITDRLNRSLELTADQAGAFRFENVPPGTVKISVEAPGYLSSVNEFDIKAREDVPARIALNKRPAQASVVVTPKELKLKKQVHFLKDQANIEPDSMAILEEIADVLKSHSEIKNIEIQGHTDNQGTPVYNLRLSQNRAQAVLDALVKLGVASSRLEARGYGQDKPLLPNSSDANRAKNRRVQLIIK